MAAQHSPGTGFGAFLAELQRRHVVRVVVAYAAVVFVVLQMAEIVLPAFLNGPQSDAALRLLVVGFVLAFPVVAALAWVYEITPQGIRAMSDIDAESGRVETARMVPRVVLLGVTVLAAGAAGLWWYQTGGAAAEPRFGPGLRDSGFIGASTTDPSGPIRSIAVLPLESFDAEAAGGGEGQDYFVAGMHEAIVSQLSQTTSARVLSRTSAVQYERTGKSIPRIGLDLGVDAVVEGSVLRADGVVRITVQLIHAASDTHLWAGDYERDFENVIALQREVASAIAEEIRQRLDAREADDAPRVAADDPAPAATGGSDLDADGAAGGSGEAAPRAAPDVQDAFFRGRYALSQDSPEQAREAARLFEDALRMDSAFTPALVGLAGARLVSGLDDSELDLDEVLEARELAVRALRRDPTSTEAAEVLAGVEQALADMGRRMAQRTTSGVRVQTFERGDSMVFVMGTDTVQVGHPTMMPLATDVGGAVHLALSRHDSARTPAEAVTAVRRLEAAGRYDLALARAQAAATLFPASEAVLDMLEHLQATTGQIGEAVSTRRRREARHGRGPGPGADALGRAVEREGSQGYWEWRLVELRARREAGESVAQVEEAEALSALGRVDEAFSVLEQAVAAREPGLVTLRASPVWDSLRADPRFATLVRGLQPPRPPRAPGARTPGS